MGKRRSEYRGRRRSQSLGILRAYEVCTTIDNSLPSAERLQLLTQYALETANSKCIQEVDEDEEEFSKQTSLMLVYIETEIEDESIYNLAADENKEGGQNIAGYGVYRAAISRTEEEIQRWDQLKAKHRENLDKEINLKCLTFKGPVNDKKWNLPDYSNMFEDISYIDSNISYQVNLLKLTKDKIKKYSSITDTHVATLKSKIESNFECSIFTDSPRDLIKSCF